MIEIKNLTKTFDKTAALNNVSFTVEDGSIFGLVGSNGAGKSTLLRVFAGVMKADSGTVYINNQEPYENNALKEEVAFISDYPYFTPGATVESMAKCYRKLFPGWSEESYNYLKSVFPIDVKQKISAMSKGMQRQSAIILNLAYNPKVILFDEIFDGLDPVVRELVKKILVSYVEQTKATVIIASHNLRELEGFCDHIGLLHLGGILMECDIDSEEMGIYRVQFILENQDNYEKIRQKLGIIKESHHGKINEITVKGRKDEILDIINAENPVFTEVLGLTLEEFFISKMEECGYDINKLTQQ
ncbi:MAG: ABC transporter ATP-binding protein [Clostridiales bacterium]|nr:ABC transporter ATP-binding protein [Clostridiales bacterium]